MQSIEEIAVLEQGIEESAALEQGVEEGAALGQSIEESAALEQSIEESTVLGQEQRIVLSPLTKEYIPEIWRIERENYSLPWSERAFCEALEREYYCFLKATDGERIAGYCGYQRSFETADITNVTVRQECRRMGIGRMMLEALMGNGFRQGVERFTLEVRASNEAALSLYQSLGFRQEGVRKGYYEFPKEDAVILWTPAGMRSAVIG
jgi:ribosomal-protein-alanine N-acetyltransferase